MTQTAKPVVVPIDQSLLGPGTALDACRASSGASAGVQVLRSLLKDAGVQVLGPPELATRRAGHGPRRARSITRVTTSASGLHTRSIDEVSRIARRIRHLLDAGWSSGHRRHRPRVASVAVWVAKERRLPGRGDRHEEGPVRARQGRRDGRCPDRPMALGQGRSDRCRAGNLLLRGQPDLRARRRQPSGVRRAAADGDGRRDGRRVARRDHEHQVARTHTASWSSPTFPTARRSICAAAPVTHQSSIAALARLTGGTGKVILLVEDEDLEGAPAQLVVVADDGTVLLQRETTVGQNR